MRNLSIVFIFVSLDENGYHRVVSVGQLSFDCRSYCGRSRRMQIVFLITLKLSELKVSPK